MSTIRDEDLILYYYRDGLTPARLEAIERALQTDAMLQSRFEALREDLVRVETAFGDPTPAAGFEDRLWASFKARVAEDVSPAPLLKAVSSSTFSSSTFSSSTFSSSKPAAAERQPRHSAHGAHRPTTRSPRRRPARAWPIAAGIAVVALGLGVLLGRVTAPDAPVLLSPDGGRRVLQAALVRHLESTERTLVLATRTAGDTVLVRELADSLLESHRLYALAAERAGRADIAAFLRSLEPVLLRLANEDGLEGPGAVEAVIVQQDLPFKIRAVVASTRRDLL